MVEHVIFQSHLSLLVADDRELQVAARDLVDVLDPATMAVDGVCRQANELDTPLGELWFELRESAQLGGTDRSVVFGVRKENNPVATNEVMEFDGPVGRFGLKVRCDGAQAQAALLSVCDALPTYVTSGEHTVQDGQWSSL